MQSLDSCLLNNLLVLFYMKNIYGESQNAETCISALRPKMISVFSVTFVKPSNNNS